tara:strand:- start:256 stop:384 length:129 start_codon:yes stop_codon:yes gene_type:complete
MNRTTPALAFALLCSSLAAQQYSEPAMREGTWQVRFVHCDRL